MAHDGELRETGPNSVASFANDLQPMDRKCIYFSLASDLLYHVYSITASIYRSPFILPEYYVRDLIYLLFLLLIIYLTHTFIFFI